MTIEAGDMVQVVRPTQCCGSTRVLGRIFVALEVKRETGCCTNCGARHERTAALQPNGCWIPLPRLKRIPDFPELADERHDEEITA